MSEFFARVKATLAEVYEVEKEIGEGGMAIVFLATDRKHGRKVAIKVMRPSPISFSTSYSSANAARTRSIVLDTGAKIPQPVAAG